MPRISVIVPTYNRADSLGETLDSVLDQTFSDFELLVVDDDSTDDTAEVVADYAESDDRVRYLAHEENQGGGAARNTGLAEATGEYVAFIDSDDVWHPEKLATQLERIEEEGEEWVAAYTGFEKNLSGLSRLAGVAAALLGNDLPAAEKSGGAELRRWLLTDRLVPSAGSCLLVEREVADDLGGYDTDFIRYQDSDFVLRILGEGKLAYVDEPYVTLGSAGDPSGDTVRVAADHLLSKHAPLVEDLERRGYPVDARYELLTAKQYFAEGAFATGVTHLRNASTNPTELPGLAHAVMTGLAGDRDTGRVAAAALAAFGLAAVALALLFRARGDRTDA